MYANIDEKFNQLINLGALNIEHLNTSLFEHLRGTYSLLREWHSSDALCLAGAYHSVYSTADFDKPLVSHKNRQAIIDIIGVQAEQIVYTYCACDRAFFWPQIGIQTHPDFLDRFTQHHYVLSITELQFFCELTVANELELAMTDSNYVEKYYGKSLKELFNRMKPYISKYATDHIEKVLD